MNGDAIGRASGAVRRTDWKRLRERTDEEVHRALVAAPEIEPTDEAFWQHAKLVMPRRKEPVTMRLDADLLAWFRRERGYQTRINAVLRTYMEAEQRKEGGRQR